MSNKLITDSFLAKKRTEPINKVFPQNKVKTEAIKKPDEPEKKYKDVKDVNDLKILTDFDLRWITRLERWERAKDYGLEPQDQIKDILLEHKNDTKYTECVWYGEDLIN